MKFQEIAHLEIRELRQKLGKLRTELFDSRMKLKVQRLANPLGIRHLRRNIARIHTAISSSLKDTAISSSLKGDNNEQR